MGDAPSSLPAPQLRHLTPQEDFQRRTVVYATTSAFMWVIWLMSGHPMGLPGVEATGSTVSASLGISPAWFMLIGLPGLARRAWEVFALPDDSPDQD
jgi:hypothetical protein